MTQPLPDVETPASAAPPRYVLDACAIIAFLNDEPGAEKAEQLIEQAQSGAAQLYVASVNVYEVYYDALRRSSPEKADELLSDLYQLPVTIVESIDRGLMREAGHFKTKHKMSVADSVALALAKQLGAQLVSTDHHEFDAVEKSGELSFLWLR